MGMNLKTVRLRKKMSFTTFTFRTQLLDAMRKALNGETI